MYYRPSESDHPSFKYIIVGDSGVGKSCLLQRYVDKRFEPSYESTVGIDYWLKTITIDTLPIRLRIFDTSGHKKYRDVALPYYRNAVVALLVYDVTRRETFDYVASWLKHARDPGNTETTIMLVGNKCDVAAHKRAVSTEDGQRFAEENGLSFIETSCEYDYNVDEAFTETASMVIEKCRDGWLFGDYEVEQINKWFPRRPEN